MRVLIAFDKFKDSLTAEEACRIAAKAFREEKRDWIIETAPLTDGGDGFCQILTNSLAGTLLKKNVSDPIFRQVEASIGMVDLSRLESDLRDNLNLPEAGKLAIVEMAQASGLDLLDAEKRDLWRTSSFGTGELLAFAAGEGADAILLGVGGSATNDLGLGALEALGLQFAGSGRKSISQLTPENFSRVTSFSGKIREDLPSILIACDVRNPLLGNNGASAVFGRQKGLRPKDLSRLDEQMEMMAGRLCDYLNVSHDLVSESGSGAAGGISFGLRAAFGARICPGFDLVSRWLQLEEKVARANLILTGEGRFDASSLQGKGPGALPAMAAQNTHKTKIKVFAGSVEEGLENLLPEGMTNNDLTAISNPEWDLQKAFAEGGCNLYKSIQAYLSCLE